MNPDTCPGNAATHQPIAAKYDGRDQEATRTTVIHPGFKLKQHARRRMPLSDRPEFSGPRARTAILVLGLLLCPLLLRTQTPPGSGGGPARQEPAAQGGMATGAAQKAAFDAQNRPITAGGFVKTGPVVFQNVAAQAGLTRWRNLTGSPQKHVIIEAKGSGVCLLDYDGDGWLDIYLVNGSTLDALAGKAAPPHAALFRNNHDGTFTDVTEKAGVANDRWGLGCAVGAGAARLAHRMFGDGGGAARRRLRHPWRRP